MKAYVDKGDSEQWSVDREVLCVVVVVEERGDQSFVACWDSSSFGTFDLHLPRGRIFQPPRVSTSRRQRLEEAL